MKKTPQMRLFCFSIPLLNLNVINNKNNLNYIFFKKNFPKFQSQKKDLYKNYQVIDGFYKKIIEYTNNALEISKIIYQKITDNNKHSIENLIETLIKKVYNINILLAYTSAPSIKMTNCDVKSSNSMHPIDFVNHCLRKLSLITNTFKLHNLTIAIAHQINILSKYHPNLLEEVKKKRPKIYLNLAISYQNNGEWSKSMPYIIKALKHARKVYSEQRTSLLPYLEQLGKLYIHLENFEEAKFIFNEALVIAKDASINIEAYQLALSHSLIKQGKYSNAEFFLKEVKEKLLSSKNPPPLWKILICRYYGELYLKQSSCLKKNIDNQQQIENFQNLSFKLFTEALSIAKRHNALEEIFLSLKKIGQWYFEKNQFQKAEELFTLAFNMLDSDKSQHLEKSQCGWLLAKAREKQWLQSKEESKLKTFNHHLTLLRTAKESIIPLLTMVIEINTKAFKVTNHPRILECYHTLGCIYFHLNDTSQAEKYLEKSYHGGKYRYGLFHPLTQQYFMDYNETLRQNKKYDPLSMLIEDNLFLAEVRFGTEHPTTQQYFQSYINTLTEFKKYDILIDFLKKNLNKLEGYLENSSTITRQLTINETLGDIFLKYKKNYTKAKYYLNQALNIANQYPKKYFLKRRELIKKISQTFFKDNDSTQLK